MAAVDREIDVRLVEHDDMRQWDDFVGSNRDSSLYHLSVWRHLITRVFDKESYYLAAISGGAIVGVLPLIRLQSRLFGDFLVSLPYVNYGGVIAEGDDAASALIARSVELSVDLGVGHMELRHTVDYPDLPGVSNKVSMKLELASDTDAQWQNLGAKKRAQIKRPVREGATCVGGGLELLDDFYSVFSRKYRDLGTPVYPRRFFEGIVEAFPEESTILVTRIGGDPVAACLLLGFRTCVEVPWAASRRDADRFGVNMFLYWNMIKFAIEHGYTVFDFGRSTPDSGTYRFKKQWKAEPVPHHWHYWVRGSDELPQLNASNPKYELAVGLWKRLPVWLANRIGPHLVQNLP